MQTAIDCAVMRGGTSKGLYFLAADLPSDPATRDAVLLAAMGSPDPRQIDGMGGANPLTSKIAIVSPPSRSDADVDYLFLQAVVDEPRIDTSQNCGNLLAAVGPFAIEMGLVQASEGETEIRIHMLNSRSIAVARIQTPNRRVEYEGTTRIDGVPGTHSAILLDFLDVAGSSCGALLPTGRPIDVVDGIECTLVDNGMPVVVMRATDFGKAGNESPQDLEADTALKQRVEAIRLKCGPLMNLSDVSKKNIPKMCLGSAPKSGGAICTRNFIPHRVHEAIGVFGAVSVATACILPGSVLDGIAQIPANGGRLSLEVEHPTGFFTIAMDISESGGEFKVSRAALLRTARLLMKGQIFVPKSVWTRP